MLLLTALALIVATVVIHGVGTTYWLKYLMHRQATGDGEFSSALRLRIVLLTTIFLIGLHLLEILLWAGAYLAVAADELKTLEAATYFSAVTFTTLGYGDITLSTRWRLLSGFQAIDGIVLIGWSTAFLFAVIQRIWAPLNRNQGPTP